MNNKPLPHLPLIINECNTKARNRYGQQLTQTMMFACVLHNSTEKQVKQATIDLTTGNTPLLLMSGKSDLIWHSEVSVV